MGEAVTETRSLFNSVEHQCSPWRVGYRVSVIPIGE
jgi:hypothetical protein